MKKLNFLSFLLIGFLFAFSFLSVKAQDENPSADAAKAQADGNKRPTLLEQLDLTPEQISQIRRLNAEKKPLMREAQNRLREANRNLDQAIYADNADETEIQARIKDVQKAQTEVIRIRSLNELAVRRVLTAEQISKFRAFREKFSQQMNDRKNRRQNRRMNQDNRPPDAPNRIFKNRRGLQRPND